MTETFPSDGDDAAYRQIEAALAATGPGRAFLDAHLVRNRTRETRMLLDAIAGLERRVAQGLGRGDTGRIEVEIDALQDHLAAGKSEIATVLPPDRERAGPGPSPAERDRPCPLSRLVGTQSHATASILDAAEQVQESAWVMREGGFDAALCDALDRRAAEIYDACGSLEAVQESVGRLVRLTGEVERRLLRLRPPSGPTHAGAPPLDLHPRLVDDDLEFLPSDPDADEASPPAARDGLERLDVLGIRERLRLFT